MASLAFSLSTPASSQSSQSGKVQICGNDYKQKHRCNYKSVPRRRPRISDVRNCTQATAAGVPAVPRNINEVVQACVSAIDSASAAGIRRMRIRALLPGLNPSLEDSFPYSEKLLLMCVLSIARMSEVCTSTEVNLRFKSTGTAASALQTYGTENPLPANINITVYDDRDDLTCEPDSVNIIINPVAARGNPVLKEIETGVAKCPDGIWVLFNPDFTADRAALGMKYQQRRLDFLATFVDVFYFRNLFVISRPKLIPIEKGALVFMYDDDKYWNTYALLEGDYKLSESYETEPTPSEISTSVQNFIDNNSERVKEVVDDEGYLKSLVFWAVLLSGLWYSLRILTSRLL